MLGLTGRGAPTAKAAVGTRSFIASLPSMAFGLCGGSDRIVLPASLYPACRIKLEGSRQCTPALQL